MVVNFLKTDLTIIVFIMVFMKKNITLSRLIEDKGYENIVFQLKWVKLFFSR